ncbi:energy transducer TonB [Nafulsella turpanensis]|uniref:energy transducer TonB n=1 Tax=Nafulsella turpanensis TaxID=1265690 RepID=UPI00135F16A7|nr:energy transducer TonB [Nafulsella turpanensis]
MLKFPEEAIANDMEGKVYLEFIVDKESAVTDSQVLRGFYGCNEEALRGLTDRPGWLPGKFWGRKVKIKVALPVKLNIP